MNYFRSLLIGISCFLTLGVADSVSAEDITLARKVVENVKDAAAFLSENGEAGLAEFNNPESRFAKGDAYVFIFDCASGTLAAHPHSPKLIGKNLKGMKDRDGHLFFVQLCEAGENPKGGWVEYWWPKPGEKSPSRKISYALAAPGTRYTPIAGIYDDNVSVDELARLLE